MANTITTPTTQVDAGAKTEQLTTQHADFLTLFDSVALLGWQPLLDDLQEVALVRNDVTLAHGFRLLSSAVDDPDNDPPPASPAILPPSRDAPG